MNQQNTISNFTPAQTLLAQEIQTTALWVAERIGKGVSAEEAITLRNHLLSLAGQVENVEQTLFQNLLLGTAPAGGAA